MTIDQETATVVALWALDHEDIEGTAPLARLVARLLERAAPVDGPDGYPGALATGPAGEALALEFASGEDDWFADPDRSPAEQRWVRALALAIWRDEMRGRRPTPAVVAPVANVLGELRASRVEQQQVLLQSGRPAPLRLVPCAPAELARAVPGMELLGGVTAQRLLRWLVRTAWQRDDRERLYVPGGLAGLAEAIGARSKKAADELRDVLNTLLYTTITWDAPGVGRGGGALISFWWCRPAAPGRPARLELSPSRLLGPGLVHLLQKGSPDRALVPILPLPPLGAVNPYFQPAAGRLDWMAVYTLRRHADELVEHGGVLIDWARLAEEAGFPVDRLEALLELWTTGDNDTGPRWRRVGTGRWTLAEADDDTRAALDFLLEAGRAVTKGRTSGRRSKSRRKAE